jgi:hypothetical protein
VCGREGERGEEGGERNVASRGRQDDSPPPAASSFFCRELTQPPTPAQPLCLAATDPQALKAAWFVKGDGVFQHSRGEQRRTSQGRGIQIQIQIPMGRPPLPRRRGRHTRAAVVGKVAMAKKPTGAICANALPKPKTGSKTSSS